MRSLLAATLFLALTCPARAEIQCMARFDSYWAPAAASGAEVTVSRCAPYIFIPYAGQQQTYRLQTGPVKSTTQVTCQWTWIPNGSSRVFPVGQAAESIICNLFLNPQF